MRVTVVGICNANAEKNIIYPAIDSQNKILYNDADGKDFKVWNIDKITCYDTHTPNNQDGRYFELSEPDSSLWQVACTDRRMTFYCPYTYGFLGKGIKLKPNKCSAGHLSLEQIFELRAGYIGPEKPFFAVSCIRGDGTLSSIMMFDRDINKLREIAVEIHSKLTVLLKEKGVYENVEKDRKVVWSKFPDLLWEKPNDLSVMTDASYIEGVPNSQLG